jgi:hypothetical protein
MLNGGYHGKNGRQEIVQTFIFLTSSLFKTVSIDVKCQHNNVSTQKEQLT